MEVVLTQHRARMFCLVGGQRVGGAGGGAELAAGSRGRGVSSSGLGGPEAKVMAPP